MNHKEHKKVIRRIAIGSMILFVLTLSLSLFLVIVTQFSSFTSPLEKGIASFMVVFLIIFSTIIDMILYNGAAKVSNTAWCILIWQRTNKIKIVSIFCSVITLTIATLCNVDGSLWWSDEVSYIWGFAGAIVLCASGLIQHMLSTRLADVHNQCIIECVISNSETHNYLHPPLSMTVESAAFGSGKFCIGYIQK